MPLQPLYKFTGSNTQWKECYKKIGKLGPAPLSLTCSLLCDSRPCTLLSLHITVLVPKLGVIWCGRETSLRLFDQIRLLWERFENDPCENVGGVNDLPIRCELPLTFYLHSEISLFLQPNKGFGFLAIACFQFKKKKTLKSFMTLL